MLSTLLFAFGDNKDRPLHDASAAAAGGGDKNSLLPGVVAAVRRFSFSTCSLRCIVDDGDNYER